MSGVPAVYYHGTGSENASRVYTETPMQHVQRTALRKKCMKSTFTLDCGKKERIRLLPYFCLSVRLSLRFRSYLYISSFNFLSLSLSLSLHLSIHLFLHLSVNISISPFVNLLFFFFTFSRNIDRYRYSLSALRNVSPMVSPFRSPSVSEGRDRAEAFSVPRHWSRFIHFCVRRSPRTRNNSAARRVDFDGRRNPVYQPIAIGSIINDKYFTNLRARWCDVRSFVRFSTRVERVFRGDLQVNIAQHGRMGKGCLNGWSVVDERFTMFEYFIVAFMVFGR